MTISQIIKSACLLPALAGALSYSSFAQKTTLVNSTEQCWSGGIAGNRGCNYTFSIAFSKIQPMPDTIWIGDSPIELFEKIKNSAGDGNMKITRTKNKVLLDITARTHYEEYRDKNGPMPPGADPNTPKPTPPKKYKGVALLSYKYRGKRCYYEIAKIMKKYPHQSYP